MSRTAKRPTIVDVARLAGVSVATVSRAMAGNYPVAAATRTRIEAAIADLGFVANANARALTGAAPRPVALVVTELSEPYFARIARGVELEASARGRLCLLASTQGSPDRELDIVRQMSQHRAEVVVLAGAVVADRAHQDALAAAARMLHDNGGNLVLLGRPGLSGVPEVGFDAEQAARLTTGHLLDLGHRRLVHLGGPQDYPTTTLRLHGFRAAFVERGLDPSGCPSRFGMFGVDQGRTAITELLDAGEDFSGVFCANDAIAQGAMEVLLSRGRRIPDDVSVTGFDDIPLAAVLRPALTTARLPLVEMARRAVTVGLGEPAGDPGTRLLPAELVVRESTGPARHIAAG